MARKRRTPRPKPPRAPRRPTPRKPRPPNVPATTRATVPGATGRGSALPATGPHAVAGGSVALDLTAPASAGLADTILEIVGAEHATLRASLAAWQREQDRVLNRSWRRPGGHARPANL